MNRLCLSLLSCIVWVHLGAQNNFTYQSHEFKTAVKGSFSILDIEDLPDSRIINILPAPKTLNKTEQLKHELTLKHKAGIGSTNTTLNKKAATVPAVLRTFAANVSQGTPNDNDFAISNGGIVASCVNSNINFYNDTGRFLWGRTLSGITNKLGTLNRTYDPRVIYDPVNDRFILVFLQGSSSADTRIIIGFTTTNDPSKPWNFYQLPGNFTGDSSWSDYPIIAINNEDLFITVNRLKDNTFWKNGFIESYIWQVNKQDGYNGDSLRQKVYTDIKYNDKAIWSICPAKNSYNFGGNHMFLLSVRPDQAENDTVFLHYINNSLSSGQAALSMRILKTPVTYGLQPNAIMPNGKYLQTNDARVLSAMDVNGMVYFVGNCIDKAKNKPGIYFGRIEKTWLSNPQVFGQVISYDSLDIGYPSIAYAGSGQEGDHSCMITFSHVSDKYFPGTSVIYVDRYFDISKPVFVKLGEGNIQLINDSVQRWGDYTGIQTKYNTTGECWLSGSYGTTNGDNRTWIGRVSSTDPLTGINKTTEQSYVNLYPNPTSETAVFEFELNQKQLITVNLKSINGQYNQNILADLGKPGINQLKINTSNLKEGIYLLTLTGANGWQKTHKFVVGK